MLRVSLAAVACAMSLTAFAAGPTLEPGLYEVTTKMEGSEPETTRKCVTAAEIAKGMQPGNVAKDCRITRNTMADGKLNFASTCSDATMTMSGAYTTTTFTADMTLHGTAGGKSYAFASHTVAKKIGGACKPDE